MSQLLLILTYFLLLAPGGGGWKTAKTDSNGDLIILEMKNRTDCDKRRSGKTEIISVETDWSILIRYGWNDSETYVIFDNVNNRIFKTPSFSVFLSQLRKISAGSIVQDIQKCTTPFALDFPKERLSKMTAILKEKNSKIEERSMFCYCCAEEMNYNF